LRSRDHAYDHHPAHQEYRNGADRVLAVSEVLDAVEELYRDQGPEKSRNRISALMDGAWRHVDPQKILKISSPDSRVHACWLPLTQELRCVILPGAL
jgi:hypothetical protein